MRRRMGSGEGRPWASCVVICITAVCWGGAGAGRAARLVLSPGQRELCKDSRLHWKFPSIIGMSVSFLRDHWSLRAVRQRLPQEVLRQENHFLFERKGVISMEAPEYSGECIVQFLKVLNREKETPHIILPFPVAFPILTSFRVPL